MSTWYEVRKYSNEITAVNVSRETEKKIVIAHPATKWFEAREEMTLKASRCVTYYPSLQQAKEALEGRLRDKIAELRSVLAKAEESLKRIETVGTEASR